MADSLIAKKATGQKLFGPSDTPLRYSSSRTRYASLHGLQAGQEFDEEPIQMISVLGEVRDNYQAMNIRSGVNVTDCPSCYGEVKYGSRRIGGLTFTAANDYGGWIRPKGEW